MYYARDLHSGAVVSAGKASRASAYACPRPGCKGRVYLPHVVIQRAHFRHYPGEGTLECDEYFPGVAGTDGGVTGTITAVEDDPASLGLTLTQVEGHWGLELRLPEIPSEELGDASLAVLRTAFIKVCTGQVHHRRVSALDLRPGVGAARVGVPPTLEALRTEPSGEWPTKIDKGRWLLECRGLEARGTLFRLRRGEWIRLLAASDVQYGETLLVVADGLGAPPTCIVTGTHNRISHGGLQWAMWEVRIPNKPDADVSNWLMRLGHEAVPRPWSVALATPPRAYSESGEPVFWVDDSLVLALQAPPSSSVATLVFESDSVSDTANVHVDQNRIAHVIVKARNAGSARLSIVGERSAVLDLAFIQPPSRFSLLEQLTQTYRLRIQIGQQTLEAWQGTEQKLQISALEQPEVLVDLGDASIRARVTVWRSGKQRSMRGLDSRGVARAIGDALENAERVEVDGGNLGRIVLLPVRPAADSRRDATASDRLAWRNHVMTLCSCSEMHSTATALEELQARESNAARQARPAALVHSRIALRRRLGSGVSRS